MYLPFSNLPCSDNTKNRAAALSESFGAYHSTLLIDDVVSACLKVFRVLTGCTPKFSIHGGGATEDIALQNIQARLRMVMSYLCAQLFPWVRSLKQDRNALKNANKEDSSPPKPGFLLVLGSGNVDEALRGYMTKYDCSSAGTCAYVLSLVLN